MRHRRKKKEKKKASAYIKLHGHVYMDLRVHSIQGNEATLTLSVFLCSCSRYLGSSTTLSNEIRLSTSIMMSNQIIGPFMATFS